jgi:hypothetical protein
MRENHRESDEEKNILPLRANSKKCSIFAASL